MITEFEIITDYGLIVCNLLYPLMLLVIYGVIKILNFKLLKKEIAVYGFIFFTIIYLLNIIIAFIKGVI